MNYQQMGFMKEPKKKNVTVISGGFPCQPHSVSGKHKASDDESDLWSEYIRIVREIKPRWIVGENVPGILSSENGRFFGNVLRELAECGYHAFWYCFPAHAVGAPFWGNRVAIVAASDSLRWDCMGKNKKSDPMVSIWKCWKNGKQDKPIYYHIWNGLTPCQSADIVETMMGFSKGWTDLNA